MKHIIFLCVCILCVCNCSVLSDSLTVHYFRYNNDYEPWNMWMWADGKPGQVIEFDRSDNYGKYAVIDVSQLGDPDKIGFIVRTNNWEKDVSIDRYWHKGDKKELWLIEGNEKIYYSLPDTSPYIKAAYIDSLYDITVKLSYPVDIEKIKDITITTKHHTITDFTVQKKDNGSYGIHISVPINITYDCIVSHPELKTVKCLPRNIFKKEFNSQLQPGVLFSKGRTIFRLFAPRATQVKLRVYNNPHKPDGSFNDEHNVTCYKVNEKGRWRGMWEYIFYKDLHRYYYKYFINGEATVGTRFDKDFAVTDPYAVAQTGQYVHAQSKDNYQHNGKGIIFDFNRLNDVVRPLRTEKKDLIVYEMHVRDLTNLANDVYPQDAGKYMGVAQRIDYFKSMGITAVEFLPVHEFNNSDAPARENPDNNSVNHWGYMTKLYFAPESYYASNCYGEQIMELRAMIDILHAEDIRVLMDVVYNHTGAPEYLSYIDQAYYYRTSDSGTHNDRWTGCGNTINTDYPMAQKLILDSLKHFVKQYGVDGFRFDLAAALSKDMLLKIVNDAELKDTIMIGEPWDCSSEGYQHFIDATRDTRWSCWNDFARNTFQDYIGGKNNNKNDLIRAIRGFSPFGNDPKRQVNYIECHDNYTIIDRLEDKYNISDVDVQQKLAQIGITLVAMSRGIPMIHSGQEFCRSKKENELTARKENWTYNGRHMWENTYNRDSVINWINWSEPIRRSDICLFAARLFKFRQKYTEFFLPDKYSEMIFSDAPDRCLQWTYRTIDDQAVVLINPTNKQQTFSVPDEHWKQIIGGSWLKHKKVILKPYSSEVLLKK